MAALCVNCRTAGDSYSLVECRCVLVSANGDIKSQPSVRVKRKAQLKLGVVDTVACHARSVQAVPVDCFLRHSCVEVDSWSTARQEMHITLLEMTKCQIRKCQRNWTIRRKEEDKEGVKVKRG